MQYRFKHNWIEPLCGLFLLVSPLHAYDSVQVERVVPLVQKKSHFDVLRVSPDGKIWGLNTDKSTLYQIGVDGKIERVIIGGKKTGSLFRLPIDFCFVSNQKIAVSDAALKKVLFINVSQPTSVVETEFSVENPGSLSVREGHVIAVGDTKQKVVHVYTESGVRLHTLYFPDSNPLKQITALKISRDGTLWALDGEAGNLHRFSAERKWLGVTGNLKAATGLDVDEFGFAYVSSRDGRWREIGPEGKLVGTFGAKGKNPGQMLEPTGVGLASPSLLWVADNGNNRFQLFNIRNEMKKDALIPGPSARIAAKSLGKMPWSAKAVYLHSDGNILTIDAKNRLQWRHSDGSLGSMIIRKKGKVEQVKEPSFISGIKDELWVLDEGGHNLKQIDTDGNVKRVVGQKGKNEGSLVSPSLFSIRPDQSFVVVDRDQTRVQVLSKDGLFLFSPSPSKDQKFFKKVVGIGSHARGLVVLDGELKSLFLFDQNGVLSTEIKNRSTGAAVWMNPTSLSVDALGNILVLDDQAGRVRIFDSRGKYAGDFSCNGKQISVTQDQTVWVFGEKNLSRYQAFIVPWAVEQPSLDEESGGFRLRWTDAQGSATYKVYRSQGNQPWQLLVQTSSTTVFDTAAIPGQSYRYAVAGVSPENIDGNWSVSAQKKAPKRTDTSLVSISQVTLNPVFTAAAKYYVDNPIGTVSLTNNSDRSYRNIKVVVSLKNYTDFATEKMVNMLEAGQTLSVPVSLTLNDQVLELSENTPVQANVSISYYEDNVEKNVSQNAPLTLYSRYAISWSDKSRLASFVTPKDPPIAEFSRSAIKEFLAPLKSATIGKPLAKAALMYEALNSLGISYVPDPKSPFSEISGKTDAIDYVQFPRETLRRKTGDCDDMTALLASLIASVGVDVALVDKPGHILLMIDTEETDPWVLGFPVERFVDFQGSYWVPIETTALGKNFMEAWQAGTAQIRSSDKNPVSFVNVIEAHKTYPPVTLFDKDRDPIDFPIEKAKPLFSKTLDNLSDERYQNRLQRIEALIKDNPVDEMLKIQLGMVYFEGQKLNEAKDVFKKLADNADISVQASAQNNLGNLAFLESDYQSAQKYYAAAAKLTPDDAGILINRARCSWKLNETDEAKKLMADAIPLMANWADFSGDFPAELLPKVEN